MKRLAQRGMTIIELMIAMIIAMIILLAVSRVYVGSVTTQRAQSDVTKLNESARFAIDLLTRHLRNAGFSNSWQIGSTAQDLCAGTPAGPAIVALNDPSSINPATANFTGSPAISVYSPATNSYNDVVRVRYYGEDYNKVAASATAPGATAAMLDCQGYQVDRDVLVEDTVFVAPNPANGNEPTLYCNTTNDSSAATATHPGYVALVSGVESFQILYGEDTDADAIVNAYVPANLVSNWNKILSAKVSVIVRSPNEVSKDRTARTPMPHFSPNYPAADNKDPSAIFPATGVDVPADGRARLMISSEVALRNRAKCPG